MSLEFGVWSCSADILFPLQKQSLDIAHCTLNIDREVM